MIFYSKINRPKRIHIGESIINRLRLILENPEDEGGIFHIQDIDNNKNMTATYDYLPDDDYVYADYTDYAKKNNLINKDNKTFNDSAGKTPYSDTTSLKSRVPLNVRLGLGDVVKTAQNMNIDKVPVNGKESIDCFNLSMLGDGIQTLMAHTYKGKKAAYPGEQGFSIKVVGSNGEDRPNLISGKYAEKVKELVNNYGPLKQFNPQWIIYPQSSSPFNDYIAEFLIHSGAFPNAKLIPNGTLVKTDFWGIDYKTLIELGLREIAGRSSDYKNCYSKFKKLRNEFYKEYFLQQLTDILEPRVCKMIPEYRKMYYLENYTKDREIKLNDGRTVKLWSLVNDQLKKNSIYNRLNTNHKNDIKSKYNYYEGRKVYGLSKYGKFLSEAVAATNLRTPEEIEADLKSRPDIWKNHTDRDENEFFDSLNKEREKTLSDLEREAEVAREEQNSKTLVNIEDVPKIENALKVIDKKYGTNELNTMNSYISSNNMSSDEREYLINNIHDYFLGEINKFNQAARKVGLPVNFENAKVSEEILLDIFREILAHRQGKKGKTEDDAVEPMIKFRRGTGSNNNSVLGGYVSNINSLVNAFKNGIFNLNMKGVFEKAYSTDTVKNYPYVSRMSLFNQFDLSDKIINYPVKPKDRILIIDDNYATGASFKNAANVIHEKLGIPYENIKALTPGDMGTASMAGRRGPSVAFNAAEANLIRMYQRGEYDDILDNVVSFNVKPKNGKSYTVQTTLGEYLNERVKAVSGDEYNRDNALKAAQLGDKGLSSTSDSFELDDNDRFDYTAIEPLQFTSKDISSFLLPDTILAKKTDKLSTLGAICNKIREKDAKYRTSSGEERVKLEYRLMQLYNLFDKKLAELSKETSPIITARAKKNPKTAKKIAKDLQFYLNNRSEILSQYNEALANRSNGTITQQQFKTIYGSLRSKFITANKNIVKFGGEAMVFPSSGPRGRNKNVVSINQPSIDRTSKPLKMAANTVQRTPSPIPRIEKVDIFNQLSSPEKEKERRMLQDKLKKVMGELKIAISRKDKANPLNGEREIVQNEINNLITQRDELRAEIRRITTKYTQTSEPVSQAQHPVNSNNNAQKKRGAMPYPEDVRKQIIADTTAQLNALIANRDKVKERMKKSRSQEEYDELRNEKALLDRQIMYARNRIFGLKNNRKMSDNAKIRAAERRKKTQTAK